MAKSKNASQHHRSQKAHRNGEHLGHMFKSAGNVLNFLYSAPASHDSERTERLTCHLPYSIKKPKTNRYPSLRGVDAKFRRNHRHALHGTAKALKERKEGKREVA
ncbi:hypothetical protein N7507_008974 [Penicillium longicatenatum]|nr:hypothetical protein N7507_008974 [Penicillium longicatenatum]